jgi:hypothetical protein
MARRVLVMMSPTIDRSQDFQPHSQASSHNLQQGYDIGVHRHCVIMDHLFPIECTYSLSKLPLQLILDQLMTHLWLVTTGGDTINQDVPCRVASTHCRAWLKAFSGDIGCNSCQQKVWLYAPRRVVVCTTLSTDMHDLAPPQKSFCVAPDDPDQSQYRGGDGVYTATDLGKFTGMLSAQPWRLLPSKNYGFLSYWKTPTPPSVDVTIRKSWPDLSPLHRFLATVLPRSSRC